MSGILQCERVFQLPLADGWTVRGVPGRTYDISHSVLEVGVNISVYPRNAVGDDIEAAVLKFAQSTGAEASRLKVTPVPAKDHSRAFVQFTADGHTWLAAFMFVATNAVLISSNSPAGDEAAFRAAEVVVASLGPIQKRRRFGRK